MGSFVRCCLGDQIKEDEKGGACSTHERNTYNTVVGKPEGKRPLVTLWQRWAIILKLALD
jgi:hypothetical protein